MIARVSAEGPLLTVLELDSSLILVEPNRLIQWSEQVTHEVRVDAIRCIARGSGPEVIIGTEAGRIDVVSLEDLSIRSCHAHSVGIRVLTGAPGYAIDDLGRLLRLDDEVVVLDETEHDLLVAGPEGQIAVTRVDGRLTIWDRSGALHWTRPARSDTGESILAVGWSEGGHPLIAREGWSHVDGDEHVLEFERWTSWEDVERVPLPSPATCILDVGGQVHIGTAGAGVHMLEDGAWSSVLSTPYRIQAMTSGLHGIFVASWFDVHRIGGSQPQRFESEGMVTAIGCSKDGMHLAIGGPGDPASGTLIDHFVLSVATGLPEGDSHSEGLMLQQEQAPIEDEHQDAYLAHLRPEELDTAQVVDHDDLFAMLAHEETLDREVVPALIDDPLDEGLAPIPHAGEDRTVPTSSGHADVVLDATGTFDPDGRIAAHRWLDERGNTIGDAERIRVRLPLGKHRFELHIQDREGRLASDSLIVTIVEE